MNGNAKYTLGQDPSPEEAAAAIAAIERFLADTTMPAQESADVVNGWLRAALMEGVGSQDRDSVW